MTMNEIRPTVLTCCRRRQETVAHFHPNVKYSYTYRFLVTFDGSIDFFCGANSYHCGHGSLLFLPPGIEYSTKFEAVPFSIGHIFFDMTDDRGEKEAACFPKYGIFSHDKFSHDKFSKENGDITPGVKVEITDCPCFSEPFAINMTPELESSVSALFSEYSASYPFRGIRANALLTEILVSAARRRNLSTANSPRDLRLVREVIEYIDGAVTLPISCASVAEKFSYHPNHLNSVFRKAHGSTLHEYICLAKIRKANELLDGTAMSVTEIAQALNFCDGSHFCRVYTKATGMSPMERRKNSFV